MQLLTSRHLGMIAAILVLAGLAYAAVLHKWAAPGWSRFVAASPRPAPTDIAAGQSFLASDTTDLLRYQELFQYFLGGAVAGTDAAGSRIHYRGAPSSAGYAVNGMEGFARTGTLLAAWIASGRDPIVVDSATDRRIDTVAYLRRGLLAGTDPASQGYWGAIRSWDQRVVEAADIARIVWLTRRQIWQHLDGAQRARIAGWLQQIDGVQIPQNVWLLFPVTVDAVLRSLAEPGLPDFARASYAKFKRNYLAYGWFDDPPEGVDFYNTWGIDYELFWIDHIDPSFDPEFIRSTLSDSAALDAHLISPQGVPIMGRSICYRTAVSVPLLAAAMLHDPNVPPGLARRGLDLTWRYFVARGALQDGTLSQGYHGTDLRFLDHYSGPGSCNWGLRSLVLASLHAPGSEFWSAPSQLLPVEKSDYRLSYDKLGWVVTGHLADGNITIEIPRNGGQPQPEPHGYAPWRRALEHVLRRPLRPTNRNVEYGRELYSATHPFVLDPEDGGA
ncbi:MAG TPA: DUF2264 domain-containing protein [Steroidobacteraceae bacterium]|jgi:hypothetical protein